MTVEPHHNRRDEQTVGSPDEDGGVGRADAPAKVLARVTHRTSKAAALPKCGRRIDVAQNGFRNFHCRRLTTHPARE
jgi:hypothetical protein